MRARRARQRSAVVVGLLLGLAGCEGEPSDQLATAGPATEAKLAEYSSAITDIVQLGANADLVQRFC